MGLLLRPGLVYRRGVKQPVLFFLFFDIIYLPGESRGALAGRRGRSLY